MFNWSDFFGVNQLDTFYSVVIQQFFGLLGCNDFINGIFERVCLCSRINQVLVREKYLEMVSAHSS